ncbi:TRAP transporter substrate-binding protein DctP [Cetobacterium sp. 2A]|uniref:C4-dicarboxylate TRAP transporter substrate-binding protein n=1 Tax=Cetobacterium sp. 2A TaxID=2754723 RepID=UPI00163C3718|nr:C4-dicarboxylate TRAP transporter substrate-binding protein [Cetobacterium sp. 2A]MBC2855209.1 TRAP transporter substrate-binding protein DctP [Cetobacterium sp. 2A]
MKKGILKVLMLVLSIFLIGCGGDKEKKDGGQTKAPEKKIIKMSMKFVDDEQTAKTLHEVANKINERLKDNLEIQVFTGGQLPIGKDSMEQVVGGANWISVDGINFLGDYIPDYNAVVGPMLYNTFDEYLAMTKSDLVKNLNTEAEKKGIKVLSLDYLFGFRSMLTEKEIKTPEDLKGLKIRVPNSQLYMLTLEAMGANPTPLPFTEVYSGIQQKVVDGLEGSLMTIYGTKIYEVRKQVSLTNHLLGVSAITISNKVWNELTDDQRKVIEEEIYNGGIYNTSETVKLEKEYQKKLEELGVKFNEVDSVAFNKAIEKIYSQFPKWTPGIYDQIIVELNKIRNK